MTNSNVTPITDKQAAPLVTFRVNVTLGGFPVELTFQGKASDLSALVERLAAIGATPPPAAPKAEATTGPLDAPAPICPRHNVAMKSGRRGFYCSKKWGDGYCDETA